MADQSDSIAPPPGSPMDPETPGAPDAPGYPDAPMPGSPEPMPGDPEITPSEPLPVAPDEDVDPDPTTGTRAF